MSNISPNPLGFRLEHDNDPGAQALCSYKRSCEIAKPNSHADVIEATWRKLRTGWFLLFVWTWTTWCPALFGMFFQRNDKFCRYICEDEQSIFTCITYRIVISTGDESPTQLFFVHLYLLQLSNEIVGPNSSLVLWVHMDRKVSSWSRYPLGN